MRPLRSLWLFSLLALILSACRATPAAQPTAAASPSLASTAQITVLVYQDLNRNGQRDSTEPGIADAIGLAPQTDCTIGDPAVIIDANTDPSTGEFTYTDLTPGLYCVMYRGQQSLTTEPSITLSLSPAERSQVFFGIDNHQP